MNRRSSSSEAFARLWKNAEQLLNEKGRERPAPERDDLLRLIHELEFYCIALELQNQEIHHARARIEESRNEFSDLSESAPFAYLTLNEKGFIERANKAALRMFEGPEELLLGSSFLSRIHVEDISTFSSVIAQLSFGQTSGPFGLRLRDLNGKKRRVQVAAAKEMAEKKQMSQYWLALVDINERKWMEEEWSRSRDELEERIKERTAELLHAKRTLETEVAERRRTEAVLKAHDEELENLNQELKTEIEKRKKFEEALKFSTETIIREHTQRKALSGQLVELLEKDRRDVAMALHDHAGQILTTLKMDLEAMENKVTQGDVRLKLKSAKGKAMELMAFIRDRSAQLRPSTLDTLGLVASVRNLIDHLVTLSREKIHFHVGDLPPRLGQDVEIALYRIIQESLNNALKYAHAENIFVNLIRKRGHNVLLLSIEDDGRGFDQSQEPQNGPETGHLGITIMQERAVLLGGYFQIESEPGKGTVVMVEIPCEEGKGALKLPKVR